MTSKEDVLEELDEYIEQAEQQRVGEVAGCPAYSNASGKIQAYKRAKNLVEQL